MGAVPFVVETNAPSSDNGSLTLDIGLLDRDSSPLNCAFRFKPEIKPIISLIPVPEFPKSNIDCGSLKFLFLLFIRTLFPSTSIDAPISIIPCRVEIGSAPIRKLSTLISDCISEPIITILWLIDLSPGHWHTPSSLFIFLLKIFKIYLL